MRCRSLSAVVVTALGGGCLALPTGCADAATPSDGGDASSLDTDGPDAGPDAGPWQASEGDRAACEAYCGRLYTCVSAMCPPDYLGDEAAFVADCGASCSGDQTSVAEARAFADAGCDEIDAVLCATVPDVAESCACSGPVAPDGTVCGVTGLVDRAWVAEEHHTCSATPELPRCRDHWIVIASDGTWRRFWTPGPDTPADQDIPDCEAGEWAIDCEGAGFGFIWLRSCDGVLDVLAFELSEHLSLGALRYFATEPPMAVGDGPGSCEPVAPCAEP